MKQTGFTLLEMVMVIVVVGIALPFILLPLLEAARGTARLPQRSAVVEAARYCLEAEIAAVQPMAGAWFPAGSRFPSGIPGDYMVNCASPAHPGVTATVNGTFYNGQLDSPIDGTIDNIAPPNWHWNGSGYGKILGNGYDMEYLALSVTATDAVTGQSFTLNTLKTTR